MGFSASKLRGVSVRWRSTRVLFAALSGLWASACGGRTEGALDGVDVPPTNVDTSPDPPSDDDVGSAVGSNGSKGTVLRKNTPLGPCVPGVEQARATTCDYYADGRCYATKLDACACVCPRDSQNSICLSSFDVPSRVSCF